MTGSAEKPQNLERIQQWMQSVITHPLGIEAGISSPAVNGQLPCSAETIEDVVTRSRACTSIERLEVYGNAYFARLLECLRELFPTLVYALGEEVFDGFAFGYLQQYPSRSYTLSNLAEHFVQYLEETRPAMDAPMDSAPSLNSKPSTFNRSWPDFLIDLARLEWTIDQVFDGPGFEKAQPLTPDDLTQITPDQWAAASLVPVPCLRLLEFQFPVNDYFTAFRKGEEPSIPVPRPTFAVITRRDYVVRRYEISQQQHQLLSALIVGATVGEAIESVAESIEDFDEFGNTLRDWFRTWGVAGFFQSVQV